MSSRGVSENRGTLFWGPYNKDPTISGTRLGSPIFGNYHRGVGGSLNEMPESGTHHKIKCQLLNPKP